MSFLDFYLLFRKAFNILEISANSKLFSQFVVLSKNSHYCTLNWGHIISKSTKNFFENLSLTFYFFFCLIESSNMVHSFQSTFNYSIFHWFNLYFLLIIDFQDMKKFISPIILILDKVSTISFFREKIFAFVGSVENITIDSRKHRIYELFKIITNVCLSLFPVCSYSILNDRKSTLIRSISRFIRSKFGS